MSVFWVHASNGERFRQAYASIAQECQVPGYDNPKGNILQLVKRWLEQIDCGRWLMVIDNADDTQLFFGRLRDAEGALSPNGSGDLGRYIPECAHGSILVTTRNKQTSSKLTKGRRPIEVGKMGEVETDQLLRTRLEDDDLDSDDLSKLSSLLEHLPLALVQAAAFVQENSLSVREYLKLLEKSDRHLVELLSEGFETVGRDSETPHAVAETWVVSFEQIQRQNSLAAELLSLMSLFDRQAIPLEFLSNYNEPQEDQEPRKEIELTKALGVLKAFSFITEDKGHRLDMHRLVQLVTQKWLVKKGTICQFAGRALQSVSHAYPFGRYESRVLCSIYLPHVHTVLKFKGSGSKDELVARASLLHNTAGFFDYQGLWKDAEKLQAQATELRREVLGEEHSDTLTSMANLASTYRNQGRWKEAEELFVQVIETSLRVLGEEHPDTLSSMANLALTYTN